jgi:hypothetical protein
MALRLELRLARRRIAHLSAIASGLERHGCFSLGGSLTAARDRRKLERHARLLHICYIFSPMPCRKMSAGRKRLGNGGRKSLESLKPTRKTAHPFCFAK